MQLMAVCAEKRHKRWLLNRHYMFMDDLMFFHLIQSGLADQIFNVFQSEDREKMKLTSTNNRKRFHEDIDAVTTTVHLLMSKSRERELDRL